MTDVKPYGVFVEVEPELSGLVHISELNLAGERVNFQPGETFPVVAISREDGRVSFSRRATPVLRWIVFVTICHGHPG